MSSAPPPQSTGSGGRKPWGTKSAWARACFTLTPDTADIPPGTNVSVALTPKAVKKLALLPRTRWCCVRCGQAFTLPRDPTTGRPMAWLLAEHLERGVHAPSTVTAAGASVGLSGSVPGVLDKWGIPACTAGPLLFSESTTTGGAEGEIGTSACASSGAGSARVSAPSDRDTTPAAAPRLDRSDGDEDRLRALLHERLCAAASTSCGGDDNDSSNRNSSSSCGCGGRAHTRAPLVFVVVENPKTPANLGSILRAMGCVCGHARRETAVRDRPRGDTLTDAAWTCNDNSLAGGLLYTGSRLDKACQYHRSEEKSGAEACEEGLGHVGSTDVQGAARTIPRLAMRSLQTLFNVLASMRGEAVDDPVRSTAAGHRGGSGSSSGIDNDGDTPCAGGPPPLRFVTVAVDLIVGARPLPTYAHPFALRRAANRSCGEATQEGTPPGVQCPSTLTSHTAGGEAVFYLFGPEDGSLSAEYVAQCDEAVYMPTVGSLNLAAAVNVLLYDRIAKDYRELAAAPHATAQAGLMRALGGGGTLAGVEAERYFANRNPNNHLVWAGTDAEPPS